MWVRGGECRCWRDGKVVNLGSGMITSGEVNERSFLVELRVTRKREEEGYERGNVQRLILVNDPSAGLECT